MRHAATNVGMLRQARAALEDEAASRPAARSSSPGSTSTKATAITPRRSVTTTGEQYIMEANTCKWRRTAALTR